MSNSSSQSKQCGQFGDFDADAARSKAAEGSARVNDQWLPPTAPPPYQHHDPSAAPGGQQMAPIPHVAGSSNDTKVVVSSDPHWDIEYLKTPMRQNSREDAFLTLCQYDTVVIMDDSGSMTLENRWGQGIE
ncbi:hypothetical protein PAXRUDRAFT_569040 [Paxillus rubicundulus Ve08.2h10]|uniref:Uncharacterized protein n=1 Tax=Paxillus rubicundulus Ve08.2h10 TaxID=930991 RepID=A0A0D0BQW3_9AGAM|nr:hypothetical protein PAXRUDRAFT_569040 [Paxillus rubicundulus Ve08.2h10]